MGLSELKVYLMDDPDTWRQTNYLTASGVAVLTSDDDAPHHVVDEVSAGFCGLFLSTGTCLHHATQVFGFLSVLHTRNENITSESNRTVFCVFWQRNLDQWNQ